MNIKIIPFHIKEKTNKNDLELNINDLKSSQKLPINDHNSIETTRIDLQSNRIDMETNRNDLELNRNDLKSTRNYLQTIRIWPESDQT